MCREMQHRLMCRHLEVFLNMSPRSACFIDKAFFPGKKQTFQYWEYSPFKCRIIRTSELSDFGLKAFCCTFCSAVLRYMIDFTYTVPYYIQAKKQKYVMIFSLSTLLFI